MDSPAESSGKGHTRTRSAVKATRPRSSTKGPLDADEISLASPLSPQQQFPAQPIAQRSLPLGHNSPARLKSPGPASPLPRSAAQSPAPPPKRSAPRPKDFSYLLRPENYHPLNPLNLPPAFRNPSSSGGGTNQPSADTPIPELLTRGHFRAAAIAATQILTSTSTSPQQLPIDPTDSGRIFSLLYTRLSCLTLIDATPIAAQEVKILEDLNSPFYLDEITGEHLVPWELRVLNVRLQAIGFGDPRRAVMAYYDLAREARAQLASSMARHDNSARELWKDRLAELGVKVAGALVEVDDLTGARVHLASLEKNKDGGTGKMAMARALLWLHLGDVDAARECVMSLSSDGNDDQQEDGEEGIKERVILALCDMADGEYERALDRWFDLREESDDEMIGVNTAVCLLYVGRMQEGKELLESLVDAGRSSRTLLFNLTTMYELCTEKARNLKLKLADKVAGMEESANGWERTNADFKL